VDDKQRLLENKRRELRRIKDEQRAAKNRAGRSERAKRKKKKVRLKQEILQLRDALRAEKERKAGQALHNPPLPQVKKGVASGSLPDFIIIGGQKCGTTFLYRLLTRHPHVKGAALKELHYFDHNFGEGVDWYRRCFRSPVCRDGRKTITGEATPSYMFLHYVPERMLAVVPQARLIALLRNPVDRAYSHYHHNVRKGMETRTFEEVLEVEAARLQGERCREEEHNAVTQGKQTSYLSRGIYVDQLMRLSKYFDDEQVLVLKSEDFFRRIPESMQRVVRFLGLPAWEPPAVNIPNTGGYAPMDPAMRQRLETFFEPHNRRLYEYLSVDYGW
jgi:hypothetical protein